MEPPLSDVDRVPALRRNSGFGRRLALLVVCLTVGVIAGFAGQHFTGSSAWFLAVPGCIIAGWLFVANPTKCLPTREDSSGEGPTRLK